MKDKSNYKVHEVFCKEVDYELLIIEIPLEEIDDKLAYFAKEKGYIPKSYYDDYIIATCVANINQLLHKLSKDTDAVKDPIDLPTLKVKIIELVLEHNPYLCYNRIVLNKNKVLKVKEKGKRLCKGEHWLKDNKYWHSPEKELIKKDKEETNILNDTEIDIKDIDDLDFSIEKMWWKRIGRYVEIKKYNRNAVPSLLKNRFFHNRTSFATFVVTVCVIDFEGLFQLLDNMGIPARVAPPLLMHELYELCQECNPYLTFDTAQDLSAQDSGEQDKSECSSCGNDDKKKMSSGAGTSKYDKSKQKKRFRDVPKSDLINLASNMRVSLIGQDKAVGSLAEAIQRASVGLKDPVKPIGSFLFAGTTGCGKSLASKVLADELIRDRNNLTVIDCSEYSADHEYSKLIGSPAGYIGFEQGGVLTNAVIKNPFSVIVFDEIEKASQKVFQLLLQVLDEGRLTDNKGTKVSFKDTVIIMTSNIGVKDVESIKKTIGFGSGNVVTKEKKAKAIEGAIKKKFKPEFLNRIDEIIYFNDLKKEDYNRIIDIELYKLNDNLQTNDTEYKSLTLSFDGKIKKVIYSEGIDAEYGARPLKRTIEKVVATPLAVKLLSGKVEKDAVIKVSATRNKAVFDIGVKVEDPPFYMASENKLKE
jgi:ATP-dependent Clp protease ATP-binding subunit ClpA